MPAGSKQEPFLIASKYSLPGHSPRGFQVPPLVRFASRLRLPPGATGAGGNFLDVHDVVPHNNRTPGVLDLLMCMYKSWCGGEADGSCCFCLDFSGERKGVPNSMAASTSNSNSGVPPGFRFHPTDEELLQYYLKKKVAFEKFDLEVIREVDLNKIEPWELQEKCRIGSAPQNEWYFFSHKDRKYPTGSRTNRATAAGFWKATGRDKCIRNGYRKIGMRKTLVFYRGRAPHGEKTDWIMHEYRLEETTSADEDPHQVGSSSLSTANEDGWVVCRVFKKKAFFKVTTGEGSSGNSGHDDHGAMNAAAHGHRQLHHALSMRDSFYLHHRDQPTVYEQQHHHHHHHVLQDLYKSDLALHYPPAPTHQPYPHLPVQNLLSDHHRTPPTGYDFPVLPCDPPPSRPYDMSLDAGACEPMQGHGCEGRDQGPNDWMMLTTRLGQDGASSVDGRLYRGAAPGNHVGAGQLPRQRPGEMDLWGYGK